MKTPLLDTLSNLAKNAKGDTTGEGGKFIRKFINSPLADVLVKITPNPYDDALLLVLRELFPPLT